jgi:hypothetical protein
MADLHPHPEQTDVAGYLLGTLEASEMTVFVAHLDDCAICQAELAELAHLPALLADVPAAETVPPDLEDRTFAAIEAAAGVLSAVPADGADVEPTTPAAGPVKPGVVIPISRGRARRQPPRWLAAAAAAVIVVAAGIGVFVSSRTGSPAPLATIRLIASDGGPAHGTAVVRATPAGLTIDMTVQGLAANRPGTMDTCWLVGPGDTLAHPNRVSVGSFVVPANGATVHVHWTTAADLNRFPHLGVTLEPINGNPSHQGPKILTSP